MSLYAGGSPFGFEDLKVYQAAREFRKRIYRLAKLLPDEERYGLAQQMRRAAISLRTTLQKDTDATTGSRTPSSAASHGVR